MASMPAGDDPASFPGSKVAPSSDLAEGLAAHKAGRLERAEQIYRDVLKQDPEQAEALQLWGTLALQQGQHAEAAERMARCRAAYSRQMDRLQQQGRTPEAVALGRQVRDLAPVHAEVYSSWGVHLLQQRRHAEAEAALLQAVAIKPEYPEALFNLGSTLHLQGKLAEAEAALTRALELSPPMAEAHYLLGVVFTALGRPGAAVRSMEAALESRPDYAAAYNGLGLAYQEQGRLEQAADAFRRAVELDPHHVLAHSNLIFLHTYHRSRGSRWLMDECRRFYQIHGSAHEPHEPSYPNSRQQGRRLRVGYLSPDFRSHVIASNLELLLASHDHDAVEVICYSSVVKPDEVTGRLRSLADRWRDIADVPDEEVARQIRQDRVDILVDLAWYTAGSRLLVLAHRPAPVQVAYLGAFASTGFPVVDYWITDRWLHPGDTTEPHTERLYRLPRCFACYQAFAQAGEVIMPSGDGPLTFGSFNTLWKLNEQVVALWAEILLRTPGSVLLFKARQLADETRVAQVQEAFAHHGVEASRLDLRANVTLAGHYAMYGEVDVALDPFPFTGGVTTFDALWMGVPVITLAGDRFTGRMGLTMLSAVKRPEWIAANPRQYVELAVGLAGAADVRRQVRKEQRQRVRRSPLCNGPGLARALERAYREMWQQWSKG